MVDVRYAKENILSFYTQASLDSFLEELWGQYSQGTHGIYMANRDMLDYYLIEEISFHVKQFPLKLLLTLCH